jgi:hypothetical protein
VKYVPAYLGLTFVTGSETLGVTPAAYNSKWILPNWQGSSGDSRRPITVQ